MQSPLKSLLNTLSGAALAAALVLTPSIAQAAGFAVAEQSVRGLGRAFSAETSFGDDASSLWFNPALSAYHDAPIVTGSVAGIFSNGELTDRGTTIFGPGTGGARVPTGGPDSTEPLDPAAVPQFGVIYPVRPGLALGLSVNAPFGLVVDHPRDFFGRFDSTRTELTTINTQASVGWAISPAWAVGVGVNAQYGEAVLESALPNFAPGAPDGAALTIKGDDWSYGWNAGVAWRPHTRVRLGAHYRSAIAHDLEGRLRISGLEPPLEAINDERAGTAGLKRLPSPPSA
jgi:long-chain fatty acid transport protein